MIANLTKGALVGGLIFFIFSALSWMVLPFHESNLKRFPDEQAAGHLLSTVKEHGMYLAPFEEAKQGATPAGPMIFAAVSPGGMTGMGSSMAMGFVTQVLTACLITWLLLQTRGLSYGRKVFFFVVVGLIIGIAGHFPQMTWWQFTRGYTAAEVLDQVVGWFLAGLAVAKVVKTA
jgi:hypothetical protein